MPLPERLKAFEVESPRWRDETDLGLEPSLEGRFAGRCLMHVPRTQPEFFVSESPDDLATVFVSFARDIHGKVETELRVGILEKVVLELRHSLAELASRQTFTVPIVSLAPEPLTLRQPIFVVVQPEGDEFSATFFDANINASGDTQTEAVDNLKEILVSTYRRFSTLGEDKLGPGPRKQLAVLQSVIK